MDADTGVVRRAALTPANVSESEVADALVSGDERAVYGDRAYESNAPAPVAAGPGDQRPDHAPLPQASAGPPLWQQRRNALIAPRRALVEKVFGTLKRSYGYQRVRYRGLGRNTVELWFKLMAYNLRKADTLAWATG